MKLDKNLLTLAGLFAASLPMHGVVIYSANFDSLPDQAPLVALDGSASVSFNANASIGDTNGTGDAAAGGIYASGGANLATRNGMRAYGTVDDANFSSASGGVGQLHTHTGGGFGVISTGPIANIGGVNNQPTPIAIAPVVGDIYRVTFDMYVQEVRTLTSNLAVNWNLKDASFNVFSFSDTWNDYKDSSVGDVLSVTKELEITQAMVDAGVTSFGPQFTLFTSPNGADLPTNTAFAQIDNFQIELFPVPEPSSMALLGLTFGFFVTRRKK
ncbi:MAG: PEP-CTERM sorting domain-containing protein [Verrucomicrobiota bacterium]